MKSKLTTWLERAADTMFSKIWQAKALIVVFGVLGICCLVGSFWNPRQLLFAVMCAAMVVCGISEYKEVKRK